MEKSELYIEKRIRQNNQEQEKIEQLYWYRVSNQNEEHFITFFVEDNLNYTLVVDKAPRNNQIWSQRRNLKEFINKKAAIKYIEAKIGYFFELIIKAQKESLSKDEIIEDPIVKFLWEAFEGFGLKA